MDRLYPFLCASVRVKQDMLLSLHSYFPWGDESAVYTCDLAGALPAWQDPLSTRSHACGFCPRILSALVIRAVTKERDDEEICLHSPEL